MGFRCQSDDRATPKSRRAFVWLHQASRRTKGYGEHGRCSEEPDKQLGQNYARSRKGPSLALVQGTILGKADFSSYFTSDGRFSLRDGKPRRIGREEWALLPMEKQFDAVLYLGSPSTITIDRVSPERCSDLTYVEMRAARMKLVNQPIDELRRYCASVAAPAK